MNRDVPPFGRPYCDCPPRNALSGAGRFPRLGEGKRVLRTRWGPGPKPSDERRLAEDGQADALNKLQFMTIGASH